MTWSIGCEFDLLYLYRYKYLTNLMIVNGQHRDVLGRLTVVRLADEVESGAPIFRLIISFHQPCHITR